MEDASKEFRIFMSPKRNFQEPYREESVEKHRIVPVVHKIFSSTSPSSFSLNRRKSNVYRAVSGVSFQNTDVENSSRKEKYERNKVKNQYYEEKNMNEDTRHIVSPTSGARRSRSLTNIIYMSKNITKNSSNVTRPFTSEETKERKDRYSRVKKRSCELINRKCENSSLKKEHQEKSTSRRARSMSRSRKSSPIYYFENGLNSSFSLCKNNLLYFKSGEQFPPNFRKIEDKNRKRKCKTTTLVDIQQNCSGPEVIDFSVDDNDWRKYDLLVTEKLETLLNNDGEPEGGYFSLERDDSKDFEHIDVGDQYERDNGNETIYISQALSKDDNLNSLSQHDQYIIKDIYSDISSCHQSQDAEYVDDEGLYEDIYFEKNNERDGIFGKDNCEENSSINVPALYNLKSIQRIPNEFGEIKSQDIKKSSTSSVIYVSDGNFKFIKPEIKNSEKSSISLKKSFSSINISHSSKDKQQQKLDTSITKEPKTIDKFYHVNKAGKNDFYTRPDFHFNQELSCNKRKSELLLCNCSLNRKNLESKYVNKKTVDNTWFPTDYKYTSTVVSHEEKNRNLPEIDCKHNEKIKHDKFVSKYITELHHKTKEGAELITTVHPYPQSIISQSFHNYPSDHQYNNFTEANANDITSPKTLNGIVNNTLFNPLCTNLFKDKDKEFQEKQNNTLYRNKDANSISCTSSSSSSSSSSSYETDTDEESNDTDDTSPWIEAQDEFTYVTFREELIKP